MARPRTVFFDIGSTLWSSPAEDPDALRDCYTRGREAPSERATVSSDGSMLRNASVAACR